MFLRSDPELVRQRDRPAVGKGGAGGGEQVELRLDAGEFGGLEQAVEQRGHLGAAPGPRAVVVLSPEDDPTKAALSVVVVRRRWLPVWRVTR